MFPSVISLIGTMNSFTSPAHHNWRDKGLAYAFFSSPTPQSLSLNTSYFPQNLTDTLPPIRLIYFLCRWIQFYCKQTNNEIWFCLVSFFFFFFFFIISGTYLNTIIVNKETFEQLHLHRFQFCMAREKESMGS